MQLQSNQPERRHIGIIGGGITGLTAAFYLLRAGAQVVFTFYWVDPGRWEGNDFEVTVVGG